MLGHSHGPRPGYVRRPLPAGRASHWVTAVGKGERAITAQTGYKSTEMAIAISTPPRAWGCRADERGTKRKTPVLALAEARTACHDRRRRRRALPSPRSDAGRAGARPGPRPRPHRPARGRGPPDWGSAACRRCCPEADRGCWCPRT